MFRGPKPKPKVIRLISTTQRSKVNHWEPNVPVSLPSRPSFLSATARREWNRVAPELVEAGVLTALDRSALAAYCSCFARWSAAERALARIAKADPVTNGLMIDTLTTQKPHPLVSIARQSMSDLLRYAAELGLTPSGRARLHVPPRKDEAAEAYFD